jgi:hypothetical protein
MIEVLEFDFYNRLRTDYIKHNSLFIAFDYDNTVSDYHKIGIDYKTFTRL